MSIKHIICIEPPKDFELHERTGIVHIYGGVFKIVEDDKILNMNERVLSITPSLSKYDVNYTDFNHVLCSVKSIELIDIIREDNRKYRKFKMEE